MSDSSSVAKRTYNSYSDKQKYDLIAAYKASGSLRIASAHVGVEYETAKKWKQNAAWWPEIEEEVRLSQIHLKSKRFQNLTDQAERIVQDRLENGEHFYDQKTGDIVRVPVKLEVAHRVWKDTTEKELLMQEKLDRLKKIDVDETIQDHLVKLLESFTKFATATEIKQEKLPEEV